MSTFVSPDAYTIPLSERETSPPAGPFITYLPGTLGGEEVHDEWLVVAEHLTSKEIERCGLWRDEVHNILVFAGLFSAVVTGLLATSYQSLQDNPTELLLNNVVAQLSYIANHTAGVPATLPSSTSATSDSLPGDFPNRTVNTLWFLSLVLSLTAALIGLVGLQWLREHLRPSARNVPLKSLPALIRMQSESLDAFYVPQVFTALPLLLIVSLILFLIGMIEFLWGLDHIVAIPNVVVISLTLAFIVYTTVRPGLQGLPGHYSRWTKEEPPALCPYKSPQSWAFLQVVILFTGLMAEALPQSIQRIARFPNYFFKPSAKKDWLEWALSWLRQRDIDVDYMASKGPQYADLCHSFCDPHHSFNLVYDTMRALVSVKEDFTTRSNRKSMDSLYAAFDDFAAFRQGFTEELTRYVHDVIIDEPPLPVTLPKEVLRNGDLLTVTHHTKFLFGFTAVTDLNGLAGSLSSQLLDCAVRLTDWTSYNLHVVVGRGPTSHIMDGRDCPVSLIWQCHRCFGYISPDPDEDSKIVDQLLEILSQIFEYACTEGADLNPDSLGRSTYVKTLLHALAIIFSQRKNVDEQATRHDNILRTLIHRLPSQNSPYLFLLASIYIHYFLIEIKPHFGRVYVRTVSFNRLVTTLNTCRHRLGSSTALAELQRSILPEALLPNFGWVYVETHVPHRVIPPSGPASEAGGSPTEKPSLLFGAQLSSQPEWILPLLEIPGTEENTEDGDTIGSPAIAVSASIGDILPEIPDISRAPDSESGGVSSGLVTVEKLRG